MIERREDPRDMKRLGDVARPPAAEADPLGGADHRAEQAAADRAVCHRPCRRRAAPAERSAGPAAPHRGRPVRPSSPSPGRARRRRSPPRRSRARRPHASHGPREKPEDASSSLVRRGPAEARGMPSAHGNCRRVHCRCMTSGSLSARRILANMARATDGVERLSNHKISLGLLIGQAHGGHPAALAAPGHQRRRLDRHRLFPRPRPDSPSRDSFDLFFIADTPAARTDNLHAWSRFPMFMNVLEPVTLLTALAGATTRIGLGGTVSTSFSEPYNVARQFASLDHISAGRAAWNVVTSANDYAARNFGHASLPPHALRYEQASEFVDVVNALWNTLGRRRLHPRPHQRPVLRPDAPACRPPRGQVLQGRRRPQHRPFAARPSGDHPGRRVRHRTGVGGRARRSWCSPARRTRRTPSAATTTSRAAWPSTAATRTR